MTALGYEQVWLEAAQQRIRQLEEQLAAAQEQILLLAEMSAAGTQSGRRSAIATAPPAHVTRP